MNRIEIKELWNDPAGQYCSEITIDARRVASVYSPQTELILVNTLADRHCQVWRSVRNGKAQRVR